MIIYYGCFFLSDGTGELAGSDIFIYLVFFLITLTTVLFVAIFALRLRLELLKGTVKGHTRCFKIISCCCIKDR